MVVNSVSPHLPAHPANIVMDTLAPAMQRLCLVQSVQGHVKFGGENWLQNSILCVCSI